MMKIGKPANRERLKAWIKKHPRLALAALAVFSMLLVFYFILACIIGIVWEGILGIYERERELYSDIVKIAKETTMDICHLATEISAEIRK